MLSVITAIKSDDDRQFMEKLYIRNYAYMKKAVWHVLGKSPNVEDVIGDAIISLIGKITLLRTMSDDSQRKYMYITAKNAALQEVRRTGNRKELYRLGFDDMHVADTAKDPLACLVAKESMDEMRNTISKLKLVDQLILYYKFEMDFNCIQIAEIMNLTHPACRSRLSRACKKLNIMWGAEVQNVE